jgi:hypothetical protein
LDKTVEQNPIKAAISESNVIVVMLVESVHGKLVCVRYQEHSFKTLSTSNLYCPPLWDIKGEALA